MKQQLLHWNKKNQENTGQKKNPKVILVGNPNSGKSSLFNHLTGLNQKIGNFPGVTVDKKSGFLKLDQQIEAEIIDLPGTYSIYPRAEDERIVFDLLSDPHSDQYPDLAIVIIDVSNLKRNLLLFSQIKDLGIPVILAMNMVDLAFKAGMMINQNKLEEAFKVPVVMINARKGDGLDQLKKLLFNSLQQDSVPFYDVYTLAGPLIDEIKTKFGLENNYRAFQLAQQYEFNTSLSLRDKEFIHDVIQKYDFQEKNLQARETIARYELINQIIEKSVRKTRQKKQNTIGDKIDRLVTHKYLGYLTFLVVLFVIFQAIFYLAQLPMDLIDYIFSETSYFLQQRLPAGPLADLLTEGVIPGIGGVLIFIPQIAILFTFIAILEESGYMSRVVFLMDKIMRKFGLSGKSVVPLISGVACAVPAIMATRSIDNWKDRITTIFVTPLMSCSARIPVYTILIALIIPNQMVWGFINLQGLALLAMYILGFIAAIFSALLFKSLIKARERSFFMMELPSYKMPRWKNVGVTIYEKVKTFVLEAGKIIIAISIILWVLASYGPAEIMNQAEEIVAERTAGQELTEEEFRNRVEAFKLENSYAGMFGKVIEPAIKPLGYDWKIGIALITSFAAREVFVGTMATIYSIGTDFEDDKTIKSRLKSEINPETGGPMYTPALAFSLMIFYAFAMQCMSTLAVVKRETKSWKWPIFQLIYLSALAYISALIVYQLLK
ncbi:MAG: ferrous iron transport protein B [Candidatus Cyclobacteriaceae bacterium M3_2C_046]